MSSEYNSHLIGQLYAAQTPEAASNVTEEMVDIKDPVFVIPIHDAYKRFKDTSMSHYFVADLDSLETTTANRLLVEIVKDETTKDGDVPFALSGLVSEGAHKDELILLRVRKCLLQELRSHDSYFAPVIWDEFIRAADLLEDEEIVEALRGLFESDSRDRDQSRRGLNLLLKSDSKKWIKYYLIHYKELSPRAEVILTRTMLRWKGTLVDKILVELEENGSSRAKELIIEKREQVETKEKEEAEIAAEEVGAKYTNSEIVERIVDLRQKINSKARDREDIGFQLFPPNEKILGQTKIAHDLDSFKARGIDLRSIIQDLNTDELKSHGTTFEEALEIVDGIQVETMDLSLNALHLFLSSRGVDVDDQLFGLRVINKILVKVAHPENEGVREQLKAIKCEKLYDDGKYEEVHAKLLGLYEEFLHKVNDALA